MNHVLREQYDYKPQKYISQQVKEQKRMVERMRKQIGLTFTGLGHTEFSLHPSIRKKYYVNAAIWATEWTDKKRAAHFMKLIKDVPKSHDDERFVDRTGTVSMKKSFFNVKRKPKAGSNSPMHDRCTNRKKPSSASNDFDEMVSDLPNHSEIQDSPREPPKKRSRGRPRKETQTESTSAHQPIKRGRGRPRKNQPNSKPKVADSHLQTGSNPFSGIFAQDPVFRNIEKQLAFDDL